jgi:SAM-dependent methyltransferase
MQRFNPSYVGARPDILRLIPRAATRILDVGCSDGTLGAAIKQRCNATVIGLEVSTEMGAVASERLDRVIVGDVEAGPWRTALADETFDVVVCADLLEHLRDPWSFLASVNPLVATGGTLIASIPNVRHIDTLFNLAVLGRWPHRERGIHDRGHLRFFTRRSVMELLDGAGFEPRIANVNYRVLERPHPWNRWARYLALPGIAPFLAFQYLGIGKKREAGKHVRD